VTLDLGLRWAREYWYASGGALGQQALVPLQPRVGVHWTTGPHATMTWFSSWGRYHERTRTTVPGFFLQDEPSTYIVQRFDHDPRLDPTGGTTLAAQTLGHQPEVHGLRAAAFDEAQWGLRWEPDAAWSATLRALDRRQREGIVSGLSPVSGKVVYGNPGRGELAPFPRIRRVYRALETTVEVHGRAASHASLSHVWSSLEGNYEGYWAQNAGANDPLGGAAFVPDLRSAAWSNGALPNDRPHQFKAHGAARVAPGVTAGATLAWQSGTPLSTLGQTPFGAPYYRLLGPRGSAGRLPSTYDVNLRLAVDSPRTPFTKATSRLLLDVYHVGNPRRPVMLDPVRYLDAGDSVPNPNYGKVLFFQPAVAYRFGIEVGF